MRIDIHAKPDFEQFKKVIRGEKPPARVHLVELGIDGEIVRSVMENVLGPIDSPWADVRCYAKCYFLRLSPARV